MAIELPSWWWKGIAVGIGLLAIGGGLTAVQQGYQDIYWSDCGGGHRMAPNGTVEESGPARDAEACRSDRLALSWWDAFARATFGPGIAIVVVASVYLLASAIYRK